MAEDRIPKKPLGDAAKLTKILHALSAVIDERAEGSSRTSYTAKLLEKGRVQVAKKLIEEGGELGLALVAQEKEDIANVAADLLYHFLVGLRSRGISLNQVAEALIAREGISGLARDRGEKKGK